MSALERIPVPPVAVSRVLSRFDRPALEGFIAVALDLLDLADGDPDEKEAGDKQDGNCAQDEPTSHFAISNSPGDLYSDNDTEHYGVGSKTATELGLIMQLAPASAGFF